MGLMVVSLALYIVGTSAAGANLLANASFEQGIDGTNFTSWVRGHGEEFRETTNAWGYTDGAFPDGGRALKQWGPDADLYQTNISVVPRVPYELSGYFYHSSTEDAISNHVNSTRIFMHLVWYNVDDYLLRHDFSANHNGTSPADTWTEISMQITSPQGAHHMTFHIETDSNEGGGSVFGDNFSFDLLNLLNNPGMEQGSGSTVITSWTRGSGNEYREMTNAFGYTDGEYPDGDYALKEFGGIADLYQGGISVTGSVQYAAEGFFYHSSTEDAISNHVLSTRMFMHVGWFDASNNILRNDYSANHNGTWAADLWTSIVMRVTSPDDAAFATFHVETDSGEGGGSVFGDLFSLRQEEPVFLLVPGTVFVFR
jgi:hypothetical protein